MKHLLSCLLLLAAVLPAGAEELRNLDLTIAPSFKERIVISVRKLGPNFIINTKMFHRDHRVNFGQPLFEKKLPLTAEKVAELREVLAAIDLEKLKAVPDERGLDGTTWTLSFSKDEVASFWSPHHRKDPEQLVAFCKLTEHLWQISGLTIPRSDY